MELMITLTIIGILIAIAVPSYQHYLAKVSKQEAQSLLLSSAKQMQQYYQNHHSYEKATTSNTAMPPYSTEKNYSPHIVGATQSTYDIEALPLKAKEPCEAWHINQLGALKRQRC